MKRGLSFFDKCCLQFDACLRTLANNNERSMRANPANSIKENKALTDEQRKHAAALMRINHSGEVCAQALYQGQSLTARLPNTREQMQQAADEEIDHLRWCHERLQQLKSHTSYLNPVWYAGSFLIGATAGFIGDKWSLGFVAETEQQVVDHLNSHLQSLPETDLQSKAIIQQMHTDEAHHRDTAKQAGAAELPRPIKFLMRKTAKIMTKTAYRF